MASTNKRIKTAAPRTHEGAVAAKIDKRQELTPRLMRNGKRLATSTIRKPICMVPFTLSNRDCGGQAKHWTERTNFEATVDKPDDY